VALGFGDEEESAFFERYKQRFGDVGGTNWDVFKEAEENMRQTAKRMDLPTGAAPTEIRPPTKEKKA